MSKETKHETGTIQSRPRKERWNWVQLAIWTERMLTALDNGVKGNKWFSLIDKIYKMKALKLAWQNTASNKGAAGVDRVTIEKFAHNADIYLKEIARNLEEGKFKPSLIRRTYIPKGDGKTRPLGIPIIKDRIVQGAIKMVIEPIWEKEFVESSYGFRPGRKAHDAIKQVSQGITEGYTYVVDADIKGYFDNIPHDRLMHIIATKIVDRKLLQIIEEFLKAGIIEEMKEWKPIQGTPQGGVLSPLLANIYLHPLDVKMNELGYKMIRYADDFVILCRCEKEAKEALEEIQNWIKENGLELHPDKTRICNCANKGEGFDFLGYHFTDKYKFVRKKSTEKLAEKIKELTKRSIGKNIVEIIKTLNRVTKGWFNYFKMAQGDVFLRMDSLTRRRLRAVLRKQEKRPGMGMTMTDHKRWTNEFFAKHGLFSLEAARAEYRKACQSR